jgi:hypothetical protein
MLPSHEASKRKPLKQRLDFEHNRDKAIDSILTDVRSCGLLVSDLTKPNTFKFAHKSFMEFLAGKTYADWLIQKYVKSKEGNISQSIKNKLDLVKMDILKYQDTRIFFGQTLVFHLQKLNNLTQEQLLKKLLIIMHFNTLLYWFSKLYLWLAILMLNAQKRRKRKKTKPQNTSIYNYGLGIIKLLISVYHTFIFLLADVLVYFIRLIKGKKRKFIVSSFEKVNPCIQKLFMEDMLIDFITWYETCTALGIDRDTMAKIVGKRAMILFEDPPEKKE